MPCTRSSNSSTTGLSRFGNVSLRRRLFNSNFIVSLVNVLFCRYEEDDDGRVPRGEYDDSDKVDSPSASIDEMLKMPFSKLEALTRFDGRNGAGATRYAHILLVNSLLWIDKYNGTKLLQKLTSFFVPVVKKHSSNYVLLHQALSYSLIPSVKSFKITFNQRLNAVTLIH